MLSLIAKIGANVSGFMRAMDDIKGAAKKTGDQIASKFGSDLKSTIFGGVTIGGATRFVSAIAEMAASAKKMAADFGISTDEAQMIEAATSRSGGSLEEVGSALTKIATLRAKIVAGDEKSLAMVKAIGLETADLTDGNRSNLAVLRMISDAVEKQGGSYASQGVAVQLVGEKAGAVFSTMAALKALGPISIIPAEQIESLAAANAELQAMRRELLVAGAERAGFWARVLNRGSQLERERPDQLGNLTRATWAEFWDTGPTESPALTADDLRKARERLAGRNLPSLEALGIPTGADSAPATARTARTGAVLAQASAIQAGTLAQVGLFSGGPGAGFYRESRQQTQALKDMHATLRVLPRMIADEL